MVEPDPLYHDPPPRMMRILRWFCADIYLEEVEGDLHELFQEEVEEYGLRQARRRFFFIGLRYLKPFFFGKKDFTLQLEYHLTMLKHYLKIAFRQLRKQRAYSFINISGLAIAMACCIVVLVFVHDETSYDNYHPKAEQVYRLSIRSLEVGEQSDVNLIAASPILWGPALKKDYPEVENFTRFVPRTSPDNPWEVIVGERSFSEARILYTDPATLDMFNWPITSMEMQRLPWRIPIPS